MRSALLIAALAFLAAAPPVPPAADAHTRVSLAVLRRDGVMLPFASYDGSWSVPWPLLPTAIPIALTDVPKKWWGAPGPDARWTAWIDDDDPRPLMVRTPEVVRIFCERRLGVRTDYAGDPYDPREPTTPKDGIALAGDAAPLPITRVSVNSPEARALVAAITDAFNEEEKLASRRFTRWRHPYQDAQRKAYPIQLEAVYRAHERTTRGEWDVTFVEAVRRFPPGPKDEGCGLITFAHGWVRQASGKTPDVDIGARVTYCDREGVSFMQPFGRLHLENEAYWIYQLSSWRDEWYVVARLRPRESRPIVVVNGGACPQ